MYIRTNDTVAVLSGDDKGKTGKVIRVDRANNKVVVQGVNLVWKHVKPNRRNQQGGRLSTEMPIDASKVALIDPASGKPTRVGVRYLPDGSKELYAKKSGATLRTIAKARKAYAEYTKEAKAAAKQS
jgi:large subunit ribosomal protein L24